MYSHPPLGADSISDDEITQLDHRKPSDWSKTGIVTVFQNLKLVPFLFVTVGHLTVAGRTPCRKDFLHLIWEATVGQHCVILLELAGGRRSLHGTTSTATATTPTAASTTTTTSTTATTTAIATAIIVIQSSRRLLDQS